MAGRRGRPATACGTGLAQAQIVKLSDDELALPDRQQATRPAVRSLWHDGLRLLTLSRGSAGSIWFTPDAPAATCRASRCSAVDTTGAGDGFMAGLLAGLLAEPDAPERRRGAWTPSAASPMPSAR